MRWRTLSILILAGLMALGLAAPTVAVDPCDGCMPVATDASGDIAPMSCCGGDAESGACHCCCHGGACDSADSSAPAKSPAPSDDHPRKPGCPGGCDCPSRCTDTGASAKVLLFSRIVSDGVTLEHGTIASAVDAPESRGRDAHLILLRPPRS